MLDVWLNTSTQEKFDPFDLTDEDTAELKTWILASCRALDLYDLNNNKVSADVPLGHRPKPGQKWWLKLGKPNQDGKSKLLLGYNFPIIALYVVAAMKEYGSELDRLSRDGSVPRDKLEIYAWLSANRRAGAQFPGSFGACAWDESGYYFISISHPILLEETAQSRADRKIPGFFRVPLDSIGGNFDLVPKNGMPPAGTEQFSIPGWKDEVL